MRTTSPYFISIICNPGCKQPEGNVKSHTSWKEILAPIAMWPADSTLLCRAAVITAPFLSKCQYILFCLLNFAWKVYIGTDYSEERVMSSAMLRYLQ